MYSTRRKIPLGVSIWMERDVNVPKATISSGLMPNDTRSNVFLRRKFYSDMLNLSEERRRKLARFDSTKKTFIKTQRLKAQTNMPGLLPYIKQHQEDEDEDSFASPTLQSVAINSMIKSVPKRQNKPSDGRKLSLERINQLAQPKSRQLDSSINDHIRRSKIVKKINVQDVFQNIENTSYQNSYKPKEPKMSTNDTRFRKLIYLFSEVHEREPTTIQSVKEIIQLNASLQYNAERWGTKNVPVSEYENQSDIISNSSYCETDSYLIETCT